MKTTFITTVFNEGNSLKEFLSSIKFQSLKPDEIIIVDGGSTDKTPEILNEFKNKNKKLNIRIIQKTGNIAVGRNEAIRN